MRGFASLEIKFERHAKQDQHAESPDVAPLAQLAAAQSLWRHENQIFLFQFVLVKENMAHLLKLEEAVFIEVDAVEVKHAFAV